MELTLNTLTRKTKAPGTRYVKATTENMRALANAPKLVIVCNDPWCDFTSSAKASDYPEGEGALYCRCGRSGILAQVETRIRILRDRG